MTSKIEVIHITTRFRSRTDLPLLMVENTVINSTPTEKVNLDLDLDVACDQNVIMNHFVCHTTTSFAPHKIRENPPES